MLDSGPTRFCPTCGGELPEDARFCANCGTTVQTSASVAPRNRSWLILAAGVGVVLVAFGVGYGLSLGSVDAPTATPRGADEAATSSGLSDATESTIPEPIEPIQPVASASTIKTFPYVGAVLSPDGRLIFYRPRLEEIPADGMYPWCVKDVETLAESCVELRGPATSSRASWSSSSTRIVWSTGGSRDVFMFDVGASTVTMLTDTGALEFREEVGSGSFGIGLADMFPIWISDDEQIAYMGPWSDRAIYRVNVDGSETARVASPTYNRISAEGEISVNPRWQGTMSESPLADGQSTVWVGSNGAIFAVDLDRESVAIVLEYSDEYQGGAPDFMLVFPSLQPVARLTDGRLLLADPLISAVVQRAGHPADATSGAYVLDIASGIVSPLFIKSPNGEYGGPIAVALSPDESELLVVWFDSSLVHPYREASGQKGRYVVSVLDVDSIDGPIDPRDLPQIYGLATDPSLFISTGFSVEWAENDTVLLSTQSEEGKGSVLIEIDRG